MSTSSCIDGHSLWMSLAAWFAMLLVSIGNGAVRDLTYGKHLSELSAHQLSTVTGILLLGGVIWTFLPLCPVSTGRQAISIGLLWMALTVAFEFLFFHFVGGHSWSELLANYNVMKGRVWVFVPLWVGVAPYVFFRVRSLGSQETH